MEICGGQHREDLPHRDRQEKSTTLAEGSTWEGGVRNEFRGKAGGGDTGRLAGYGEAFPFYSEMVKPLVDSEWRSFTN